jgi:hypothetical protein
MTLNKEIANLTSRVNQLERAEQRRLTLKISERSPMPLRPNRRFHH